MKLKNTVLEKHFDGLDCEVVGMKNNFVISSFAVSTKIDFLYAAQDEDEALLLNVETFGRMSMKDIAEKAKTERVAVVHEQTMKMYVFNVEESEIVQALLNQ
ncbi:hypothetical protein [Vagococcus fluvialis]|uniref:hypothetical protein n=1 Tax=Vagococcus fluvialis TaxID=2738 RepID=UPI001D0AEAED|nr:hypothetical protein [Vagococcus fluvialis]UDM72692.1 hypothetical protein K5L00_15000 [Vagococcus fluvialis]UDM78415.1 hypothetical protein K5K98_14335 [Vagococcus fluvialis]UDM83967.1 hypothetical protein K5K96_15025 [Vagococcus fluvialis]